MKKLLMVGILALSALTFSLTDAGAAPAQCVPGVEVSQFRDEARNIVQRTVSTTCNTDGTVANKTTEYVVLYYWAKNLRTGQWQYVTPEERERPPFVREFCPQSSPRAWNVCC